MPLGQPLCIISLNEKKPEYAAARTCRGYDWHAMKMGPARILAISADDTHPMIIPSKLDREAFPSLQRVDLFFADMI